MAERRTEITINVYSGVPFDNKYENVLFVDSDNLAEFLSHYEIGSNVTSNRFEIIDDTQAIVDLTNDFECMNANYCKVHRKIMPETNEDTYEYDAYYFVTRARQIATNVIRLYLELDVFQTQFNKYDYQNSTEEIPEIKKSNVVVSTDFDTVPEKMLVDVMQNYNDSYSVTPLWTTQGNTKKVVPVFKFTDTSGEYCAIGQNSCHIYDNTSDAYPYDINTLLSSIYAKQQFYNSGGQPRDINITSLYLIPEELMQNFDVSNLSTNYYRYNTPDGHTNINFYITQSLVSVETRFKYNYKMIDVPQGYKTTIGTFTHQIELNYNKKQYTFGVRIIASNTFQILMQCNNEIVDVTQDFEYTMLESDYAKFMNEHQSGLAIKGITNALNLISGVAGLATGNPASALTLSNTITNIGSQYAEYADLQNKPLKIQVESNFSWNLYNINGFGLFTWKASNYDEIIKNTKYFGYRMYYLTDKTFEYIDRPIQNVRYNFNYYKFSNVNIVGKIPLNFKEQIENMFLRGIRIWYNSAKFLQTIENKENVT